MPDLLTTAAAAFVSAVFKKPGEQLGEAISQQVQSVRDLISRKSPEDAKVIEAAIAHPESKSETDLMAAVLKIAQKDEEVKEALTTLANTVQPQTVLKQKIEKLGNQFNAPVTNSTFNQTFN